jgi:hypothetical protein
MEVISKKNISLTANDLRRAGEIFERSAPFGPY